MNNFFNYPDTPSAPPERTFWATRSQRDWRKLLKEMQTLRCRPNETPIRAGDPSNGFYLVSFGRFQADDTPLTPFNEGDVVGSESFFTAVPHTNTLIALTDGELLHMTQNGFDSFAAREPELARAVLMELGRIVVQSKER